MKRLVLLALFLPILFSVPSFADSLDGISLSILPNAPFVRTTDTKISDTLTYHKNWFRFSMSMVNDSEEVVTVVGVRVRVFDKNGKVAKEFEFDPAQEQFEDLPTNLYFEQIAPGNISTKLNSVSFVVDGIEDFNVTNNYEYKVEIRVIGWTGNYENPNERLQITKNLVTQ